MEPDAKPTIVLIHGAFADASGWSEVIQRLSALGYSAYAPANPLRGVISDGDYVRTFLSTIQGPVVLVGHSGGGAIAHAVADARPDRVARVVYVDSAPLGDGQWINDQLPADAAEIPLPEWSEFDEDDLADLDDTLRATFRARAIPQPAAVASDHQVLTDERRYDVPATIIACEYSSDQLRGWIEEGLPYVAELAAMRDVEYVDLPTGHWPQFTKPAELAAAILGAVDRG